MQRRRRAWTAAAAAALVGAGFVAVSVPAGATNAEVGPGGSKDCPAGQVGLKVDNWGASGNDGTYTGDVVISGVNVPVSIIISNSDNAEPPPYGFDWASNLDVATIVVKGGSGAGSLQAIVLPGTNDVSGTVVSTVTNKAGHLAAISHVTFCFGGTGQPFEPLGVVKTAETSYTRTVTWTIDKTGAWRSSGTDAKLFTRNLEEWADYEVSVDKTVALSEFVVSGSITLVNPNSVPVPVVSVTDTLAGATCTVTPPATASPVPASGSLVYTYSCALPASTSTSASGTNTAEVTWTHPVTMAAEVSTDTEDYAFADATVTLVGHETVDVFDDLVGPLGTVSDDASFPYSVEHPVPYGCSTVTNTATITQTAQSDSVSLEVCRIHNSDGFTRGYWSNRNGQSEIAANWSAWKPLIAPFVGPGKALPDSCSVTTNRTTVTGTFSTATNGAALARWVSCLQTRANSSGNALTQFQAQFVATLLNTLKTPSLASVKVFTDPLPAGAPSGYSACMSVSSLLTYGNTNVGYLTGNKAAMTTVIGMYDAVNNNRAWVCG